MKDSLTNIKTKLCNKCGNIRPISEFRNKNRGHGITGLQYMCKYCQDNYQKKYQKEYRKTDKSKEIQRKLRQTEKNKNYHKEYDKKYRKEYRKTDKYKEYRKRYDESRRNIDKYKISRRDYNERRRDDINNLHDNYIILLIKKQFKQRGMKIGTKNITQEMIEQKRSKVQDKRMSRDGELFFG